MPETAPALKFAALALLGALLVLGAVLMGWAAPLDALGVNLLRAAPQAPRWGLEALRDLTALGSFTVLGLAVASVTLFLLAQGRGRLAGFFLASALGASAFSTALKAVVDRARPEAGDALVATFTRSFPSGHALLSAAILLTIGGFLAAATPKLAARRMILAIALGLSVLIGLSRIMLGVHWPSDVLAGWLFGLGWALLTLHLAQR